MGYNVRSIRKTKTKAAFCRNCSLKMKIVTLKAELSEIALHMNSFVVNVGDKLASKMPPSELAFENVIKNWKLHFN